MLPVLYRPAVSYLRVECDKILLFLMYCVPYKFNYVILGLLSGGGGGARYFWGSTIVNGVGPGGVGPRSPR